MSDAKYGRLFTERDVRKLLASQGLDDDEATSLIQEFDGDGISAGGNQFAFPADEPLFLLRGQDAAANGVVWSYAYEAHRVGASRDFVTQAMKAANDIREWADANRLRIKVPN